MSAKTFFAMVLACLSLGAAAAHADDKQAAATFADSLGRQSLAIITNGSLPKETKQSQLETLFSQNVNIDWIGKFVLGRYWKTATDDQKQHYTAAYRNFTIKHYTANISDFTDANFEVAKTRPDEKGGTIVTMRIKRPQAEDIMTDFDIRAESGAGLKVYDIIVEGVSMITTQRSDFSAVVSQKGIDYLIGQLQERAKNDPGVASEK